MYYSYHNNIKKLIDEGHCKGYELVAKWNTISPAMVLYFDNHRPMPVREHMWDTYMLMPPLRKLERECDVCDD